MTAEQSPSSRRAVLLGAAAGVAALAVEAVARPLGTSAAEGDELLLGRVNESDKPTWLKNASGDAALSVEGADTEHGDGTDGVFVHSGKKAGLIVHSDAHHAIDAHSAGSEGCGIQATSDQYMGVHGIGDGGWAGVLGDSDAGDGVRGSTNSGAGVAADSNSGPGMLTNSVSDDGVRAVSGQRSGVQGTSDAVVVDARELVDVAGVYGRSTEPGHGKPGEGPLGNGLGVLGRSGTGVGVRGESDGVGVEGRTSGPESIGVLGGSPNTGVHGSGDRVGVWGKSLPGVAVQGDTQDGIAVSANVFGSGVALIAHGPVIFDSAGRVTIPRDAQSVTVTSPVGLDVGSSKVLVTLLGNPTAPGKKAVPVQVCLSHVEITSETTFAIVLTDQAGQQIDAAFFVIR
jgi:hypothetical protein